MGPTHQKIIVFLLVFFYQRPSTYFLSTQMGRFDEAGAFAAENELGLARSGATIERVVPVTEKLLPATVHSTAEEPHGVGNLHLGDDDAGTQVGGHQSDGTCQAGPSRVCCCR